jgi:hypothetical protein
MHGHQGFGLAAAPATVAVTGQAERGRPPSDCPQNCIANLGGGWDDLRAFDKDPGSRASDDRSLRNIFQPWRIGQAPWRGDSACCTAKSILGRRQPRAAQALPKAGAMGAAGGRRSGGNPEFDASLGLSRHSSQRTLGVKCSSQPLTKPRSQCLSIRHSQRSRVCSAT